MKISQITQCNQQNNNKNNNFGMRFEATPEAEHFFTREFSAILEAYDGYKKGTVKLPAEVVKKIEEEEIPARGRLMQIITRLNQENRPFPDKILPVRTIDVDKNEAILGVGQLSEPNSTVAIDFRLDGIDDEAYEKLSEFRSFEEQEALKNLTLSVLA